MKDMIKRVREEKGGFTLAELLIVVAIILVLVAIAVPVFTGNLDQARKAVDEGNKSNVKSVAAVAYMNAETKAKGTGAAAANGTYYVDADNNVVKLADGSSMPDTAKDGPYKVTVGTPDANDNVTINVEKISS